MPQQPLALLREAVLGGACGVQGGLRVLPVLPRGEQGSGVHAGVGVEQGAHGGRARQALPGMLAVNVHQAIAQFAQLGHGGAGAIDPGAAAPGGVDGAAQQQHAGLGTEAVGLEPGDDGRWRIELGGDFAARLPFTHPQGVAAPAQGQLQRVDQDGFAGAGLARQHREAGLESQLQLGHDDEVAQAEVTQGHASQ